MPGIFFFYPFSLFASPALEMGRKGTFRRVGRKNWPGKDEKDKVAVDKFPKNFLKAKQVLMFGRNILILQSIFPFPGPRRLPVQEL